MTKEGALIKLPPIGEDEAIPIMKFTSHKNKLERPYIVYADTEALSEPFNDEIADRHEEILRQSGKEYKAPGRRITKHKATAACLHICPL